MEEFKSNLLKVIDRIYENGLKKLKYRLVYTKLLNSFRFPACTKLRLAYGFFLLELFHNKPKALLQFEMAERGKTDFDEQFLIFRYKYFLNYIKENITDFKIKSK